MLYSNGRGEEGEEAVFYAALVGEGRREKFAYRAKTMPLLRSSGAERRWFHEMGCSGGWLSFTIFY